MINNSNISYKYFVDNLHKFILETMNLQNDKVNVKFRKKLLKAKRIFFTGTGSSLPSAMFAAQYCTDNLGLPAQFLPNGTILGIKFNKNDLVFLSTQGFNRGDAELVVKKVKKDNATLAVLTANTESPFKDMVDYLFYFTPFPEKLFCRPIGVQTSIIAVAIIFMNDVDYDKILESILHANKKESLIFNTKSKYVVLSSGIGMPIAINYSLALREGCGIDSQVFDIETYGHGLYVSDLTLKNNGVDVKYITIDIKNNDHLHASIERISPFVINSKCDLIKIESDLNVPYAYVEHLTFLANSILKTNITNNYDLNEPYGKEENRYYHKAETYNLPRRDLELFIQKIKEKTILSEDPILVEVSGGSCTGKSTFMDEITRNFDSVQIIAQDNYQRGKGFEERKESIYKFDDLRNFQIERCSEDMKSLLKGNSIEIPNFNLVENIQDGTNLIHPKKINILEGIYASFAPLDTLSDFKLYIEAPYYLRFLRRIARFINSNQGADLSIPLKQITSFVELAHKDIVTKQKGKADLILSSEEVIPQFQSNFDLNGEEVKQIKVLFKKDNTDIVIGQKNGGDYLLIYQEKSCCFCVKIDKYTKNFLSKVSWIRM